MISFFLVCLVIMAAMLPLTFVGCVGMYMFLYGVGLKAAFVCIYRAWKEPL